MRSKEKGTGNIYNFDSQGFQKIKNSQENDQNNKTSSQNFQGIHFDISKLRKSEINGNYQTKQAVWQIVAISLLLFTLSAIAYSVVALQELSKSVQRQQIQFKDLQSLERDYQQILSLSEKLQQTQIEQNQNIGLIKNEILAIKNVIEQVKDLPSLVNYLQLDSQKLQSIMTQIQSQGLTFKIDEIKSTLNNVLTQQQNLQQTIYSLPNNSSTSSNINSEISSIKESVANLQTSMNVRGIINTIIIHGPFTSEKFINAYIANQDSFTYFQTTQICQITTIGKAVITLIANGLAICNNGCRAQMTFMKNRTLHIQKNGYLNFLSGVQLIAEDWLPISLTQEFLVEAGTHEFVLGINLNRGETGTVVLESLSFIAKQTNYT